MSHGADDGCKEILLESLCPGDAIREIDVIDIPVQLGIKSFREALLRSGRLVVQKGHILLPILCVQPEIVDEAQGDEDRSETVVAIGARWLVPHVHLVEPLVEGEDTLDIPLADAAARAV